MPPRYSREQVLSAVRELEAGVKAPIVCQRHGVSERTLYRWRRDASGGRFASGAAGEPGADAECAERALAAEALRVVVAGLGSAEQVRALRAVETALRLTRGRARQLLGLAGEQRPEAEAGGAGARPAAVPHGSPRPR